MKNRILVPVYFAFLFLACKKNEGPLHSGTITYYHEINGKIVSVIYIPSAFTPNGDGINDEYRPVLRGCRYNEYSFSIQNSSGKLIFETNNISQAWDGTSPGTKSRPGTYQYQVIVNDTTGYRYAIGYAFQLIR